MFSNNFHCHDYNKEESKTALYGTKITVPECTVCPAATHANTVALTATASYSRAHTHTHTPPPSNTPPIKNTYTQKLIIDIHTEVTATTVYTVLC